MKIKDEKKPTADKSVNYYSASILGGLGRVLLISTILGILLIPVFLLCVFSGLSPCLNVSPVVTHSKASSSNVSEVAVH